MALTQRLEFRQSQSLVMTPQLMQAIKLLQLSNLDLSAFVEEELERNPLLERASDGPRRRSPANPRRNAPNSPIPAIRTGFGDEGGGASRAIWPQAPPATAFEPRPVRARPGRTG
jgi:RNA polymerase sigma-54 factor